MAQGGEVPGQGGYHEFLPAHLGQGGLGVEANPHAVTSPAPFKFNGCLRFASAAWAESRRAPGAKRKRLHDKNRAVFDSLEHFAARPAKAEGVNGEAGCVSHRRE